MCKHTERLHDCSRWPTSSHLHNLLQLLLDFFRRQDFAAILGYHLHVIELPLPGEGRGGEGGREEEREGKRKMEEEREGKRK